MKIMLCGAADTSSMKRAFENVVTGFSATPVTFLDASHSYINGLTSSFAANSIQSVDSADICVFVIKSDFGQITWNVEYEQAMRNGKPFIIMCEDGTYSEYLALRKNNIPFQGEKQNLFEIIFMMENARELTICRYLETEFENKLREQLGHLLEEAVHRFTEYKRRETALFILHNREGELTDSDITALINIATDEYERKNLRKEVILCLAGKRCIDRDTALDLICSWEQGVSRITLEHLDSLLPISEYSTQFLGECVQAVNKTDDIGAKRRLIHTILDMDLRKGLIALSEMELSEVGCKRRLSGELVARKSEIIEKGLQKYAIPLAKECHKKASDGGWREECKRLIAELENNE